MPRITAIPLTAAFVAALALAGCGAKEKAADAAEPVAGPPASTAAPYEAGAETGAEAEAPGKVLLETRCTTCHDIGRVRKEKAARAGWEKIVDRMVGKGAKLDDAEREAVVEYLAATYGE
jgi:mono/diheme cytochrome c family protein